MNKQGSSHSIMHQAFVTAKDSLVRMVSRIVPPKEIEDIVQETYVKICQLEHQAAITQPRSFLMKTAKNLAFDHLKKAETRLTDGVEDELQFGDLDQADTTFDIASSREEFGHFCEAVRHLPVQCRRVFVLKKVYGYSQKEIATEMNLSESTVEKHVANGFKRCASYMLKTGCVPSEFSANQESKSGGQGYE